MEVGFTTTEPLDLKVDALVLPHFDQEPFGPFLVRIDEALGGELSGVVRTGDASPSLAGRMVLPTLGRIRTPRILLMGLGRRAELDPYRLRNAYEIAGRKLKGGARRLGVVVEPGLLAALGGDGAAAVRAVVTGIAMGNCETDEWRADSPRPGAIESVQILGIPDNGPTLAEVARKAEIVAAFANRCRTWQWQPSNFLTPTQMGREAAEMAKEVGLECTVLEKPELEALGMGLLLGVARGSHEPPCVVVLRYRPKHEDAGAPTLGLVGKGITFDSGGTSLKPATRMGLMKADMSGGASVVAAMGAISLLKAPISVIGVVPLTENMPGGAALKPGDIIRALDGRSVEIINTDAEGRLVLADGLTYAAREGATHLVDVASLTGYVRMALGHTSTGAMTNNSELLDEVRKASEIGGERIWEMPMYPEFNVCLDTDVADMKNLGASDAGGISHAAVFLRAYVGELPWVHLDICGSFVNDEPSLRDVLPDGPTGAMVRTLAYLPFTMDHI